MTEEVRLKTTHPRVDDKFKFGGRIHHPVDAVSNAQYLQVEESSVNPPFKNGTILSEEVTEQSLHSAPMCSMEYHIRCKNGGVVSTISGIHARQNYHYGLIQQTLTIQPIIPACFSSDVQSVCLPEISARRSICRPLQHTNLSLKAPRSHPRMRTQRRTVDRYIEHWLRYSKSKDSR